MNDSIEEILCNYPPGLTGKQLKRAYREGQKQASYTPHRVFTIRLLNPITFEMEYYVFDRYGNPL